MSQTVGELFINLGIKGSDTAFKALSTIKNSVTDMSAAGIAAKAAILGAVYALEQFSTQSGQYGAGIKNFSDLTGISIRKIQQLGEVIRETNTGFSRSQGIQEAEGFLKSFQDRVANWRLRGSPHGDFISEFAAKVGYDLNNTDPTVLFKALQRYADLNLPAYHQNKVLESLGATAPIILAAKKFKDDIDKVTKNVESDELINVNAKVAGLWSGIWANLDGIRDKYVAKWGLPILTKLDEELKSLDKTLTNIEKRWDSFANSSIGKTLQHAFLETTKPDSENKNAETTGLFGQKVKLDQSEQIAFSLFKSFFESKIKPIVDANATKEFAKPNEGFLPTIQDLIAAIYFLIPKSGQTNPNPVPLPLNKSVPPALKILPGGAIPTQRRDAPVPVPGKTKESPSTNTNSDKSAKVNVNINQYGIKDSFDSIDQHSQEVARAYYSIATIGQVV